MQGGGGFNFIHFLQFEKGSNMDKCVKMSLFLAWPVGYSDYDVFSESDKGSLVYRYKK
jgi:hypothetical protein